MPEVKFFNSKSNKFKILPQKLNNSVNGNSNGKINGKSNGKKNNFKNSKKGKIAVAVLVAIISVVGLLVAGAYVVAIKPALSLMTNINTLEADLQNIQTAAAQRDLIALEKHFDETEQDLKDLRTARDENIGWAKDFSYTQPYYVDSDHFIDAGFHLLDAGREAIVLMKPFADAGGFKVTEEQEVEELGLAEAFATWVGIMPQIAQDLDGVLEKLALAGEELEQVDSSRYPEDFRGFPLRSTIQGAQTGLVQLNDAAPDIKQALTIIPPLLGVDTPEKRYMILFQNDKELRATGGFWTYVSTFKLNNALLSSDFTSNGTYNVDFTLDVIDAYYTFPKVPTAYENHLKVERMFARDANISPDLPTSVDQFMVFWNLAMPYNRDFKPVDGVFTIDTVVLEELLEITGPVTLNGVTYTPETVTLELEKIASLALKEQANRKRILGDLMERMLVNVFESEKVFGRN